MQETIVFKTVVVIKYKDQIDRNAALEAAKNIYEEKYMSVIGGRGDSFRWSAYRWKSSMKTSFRSRLKNFLNW